MAAKLSDAEITQGLMGADEKGTLSARRSCTGRPCSTRRSRPIRAAPSS